MLINGEEVYLYNPFDVKRWTVEDIEKEVGILTKKYFKNPDSMYEYSNNIEILSNIMYLFGEMISRCNEEFALMKLDVDYEENKEKRDLRKQWIETTNEKAPAMEYFEAAAKVKVKEKRKATLDKKSQAERFRYAYDSYQEKINALKKKMESIKYEEFNQ